MIEFYGVNGKCLTLAKASKDEIFPSELVTGLTML